VRLVGYLNEDLEGSAVTLLLARNAVTLLLARNAVSLLLARNAVSLRVVISTRVAMWNAAK
jgi:hypothetical protein